MHMISGFGGHKGPMFKRAIPMSTGLFPTSGHADSEAVYKRFLSRARCIFPLIATPFLPWMEDGAADRL